MQVSDSAPTQNYALKLANISKTFDGVKALANVAFDVLEGEVHCLAGENGCGKSTLIKIATGVYKPENGAKIEIFGTPIETMTPTLARDLGIAVIWQDLALFPHMTVAQNIVFDLHIGNFPRLVSTKKERKQALSILHRLGIKLDIDSPLNALPIAQRQIVAIARALMGHARLVFMDEPTASLTQSETDKLLDIARTLSRQGVAIIFVSHRLTEVLQISTRVSVLRDGQAVGVYPTDKMTPAYLGELMTGIRLHQHIMAQKHDHEPIILETKKLTRHDEFENISFQIRQGEIIGLIGLIGAGRSELAHCLIGMTGADQGCFYLHGKVAIFHSIRDAIRHGIAYVSEDRLSLGLIQPQSIADNISITVLNQLANAVGLLSRAKKEQLVAHWIRNLAIKIGHPDDAVSALSGGNQQRIVLAKWLATKPKLLILDSPTVGVDVGARAGIYSIMHDLAKQGLSILLISDEVSEVILHSDRVLHMESGRILGEYDPHVTTIDALEGCIYG